MGAGLHTRRVVDATIAGRQTRRTTVSCGRMRMNQRGVPQGAVEIAINVSAGLLEEVYPSYGRTSWLQGRSHDGTTCPPDRQ